MYIKKDTWNIKILAMTLKWVVIPSEQHENSLADSWCTFAACDDRYVAWTGAAIKDDRLLYPRNEEMGSFTGNIFLNSSEPVKYHSAVPCINCRIKDK